MHADCNRAANHVGIRRKNGLGLLILHQFHRHEQPLPPYVANDGAFLGNAPQAGFQVPPHGFGIGNELIFFEDGNDFGRNGAGKRIGGVRMSMTETSAVDDRLDPAELARIEREFDDLIDKTVQGRAQVRAMQGKPAAPVRVAAVREG